MRHGPYPRGFDRDILHSEAFPDFASELAGKAAKRMAELKLQPGSVFIKLGRKSRMEQLLFEDGLRLQPATFYSRPEINQAVQLRPWLSMLSCRRWDSSTMTPKPA